MIALEPFVLDHIYTYIYIYIYIYIYMYIHIYMIKKMSDEKKIYQIMKTKR